MLPDELFGITALMVRDPCSDPEVATRGCMSEAASSAETDEPTEVSTEAEV